MKLTDSQKMEIIWNLKAEYLDYLEDIYTEVEQIGFLSACYTKDEKEINFK